jgi:WD40 repeat protein
VQLVLVRSLRLGLGLLVAASGACRARPLFSRDGVVMTASDAGSPAAAAPDAGAVASSDAAGGGRGDDSPDGSGGTADPTRMICPPGDEPAGMASGGHAPDVAGSASAAPFPCDPLPRAFFFPKPGPGEGAAYNRCASLDVGIAGHVAVSPDGRRAALVTGDGLVRVVELASRTVVGVLAPPGASIGLAAFSPAGDAIVTVARGERQVMRWRTDTWAPAWTTTLPGHRYMHTYTGGISFTPDGSAVVVSPGSGLFRLNAATGMITASRPVRQGGAGVVVLELAHGWNGRRVVLTESTLTAHCQYRPDGGWVTILDPDTLAPVAEIAAWAGYSAFEPLPAARVSPTEDLVLTPGNNAEPAIRAFRVSDGARLPAPPVDQLPRALLPDRERAVMIDEGELQIVRLADRAVLSRIRAGARDPLGVSPDGQVLAVGGSGEQLLRLWDVAGGTASTVCAAEPRAADQYSVPTSLSGVGDIIAMGFGPEVRILRRADAAVLAAFRGEGNTVTSVRMSPDGRHVIAAFAGYPIPPSIVFRIEDGARAATLPYDGYAAVRGVFSPDGNRLYFNRFEQQKYLLVMFDLITGAAPTTREMPMYTQLIGFSVGCPVLWDKVLGIWRACEGCDDTPIASAPAGSSFGSWTSLAHLSPDGRLVVADHPRDQDGGLSLWRLPGQTAPVWSMGPRAEEAAWEAREVPVAIAHDARRLVTGATPGNPACYAGPAFETRVHDIATRALVGVLPPGVSSADSVARTLAIGPQIWCAR